MNNKFKITEDSSELNIQHSWFRYMAFFLIFFCVIWDGILFFIYSMMLGTGDLPLFAILFPMIHVAVGVGLTYYTVCLFVNKTQIRVTKNDLEIKHGPLPWFGNKKINSKDLKQLYVKEKVNRGKNGVSYSYQLRAQLKSGKDITLVSNYILNDATDAQFLESKIEGYLGIQDYRVGGEYGGETKPLRENVARIQNTEINPVNVTLENLKKGFVLDYKMKTWEVVFQYQLDWKNGQTDNFYQLVNESNTTLLYIKKEMGVSQVFVEEKIDYFEFNEKVNSGNDISKLPSIISLRKQAFRKEGIYKGNGFSEGQSSALPTTQYFYQTVSKQHSLRVMQQESMGLTIFIGTKANSVEFSNILPV